MIVQVGNTESNETPTEDRDELRKKAILAGFGGEEGLEKLRQDIVARRQDSNALYFEEPLDPADKGRTWAELTNDPYR